MSSTLHGCARRQERDQLAALVLDHGQALADRRQVPGVAALGEQDAVGRVGRLLAAGDRGELLGGDLAGTGGEVDGGAGVVGGEGGRNS